MKKIGIAIDKMENSELCYYLVKYANHFAFYNKLDPIIFFKESGIGPIQPIFASMQFVEVFSYYGDVICTSFSTAESLINNCSIKQKYIYVWDFEWLRKPRNYFDYAAIYRNPEYKIITRTEYQANIFENCWNRKVDFISHDFNLGSILNVT